MSAATAALPGSSGNQSHGHAAGKSESGADASSKRIVTGYGFWVFLISDIIMFAAFFAAYAVLSDHTAGGPTGHELFKLQSVAIETACLLTSSLMCGISGVGAQARRSGLFYLFMAITFALGATFLWLEISEFTGLIAQGAGPQRSAFLSSFFALVGCHGVHVTLGLLWLLTMMAQVAAKGFRDDILRRIHCFNLFWHTLDIVWVALFGLVYLVQLAR